MIAQLTGKIISKQAPVLVLDVNGVGYEIEAPMSTFYELGAIGEKARLHTHLMVREDAHILYGFHSKKERQLFRTLLKISGVGGKMALAILSTMHVDEFALAVHHDDLASMTRIPGVGQKTAQRLIVELRDKLNKGDLSSPSVLSSQQSNQEQNHLTDAISALIALGYRSTDANKMIRSAADKNTRLNSEELIRQALQGMVKK